MTTYAAKRHLLAWVRQQLVTELDEAQIFPEQREQIVKYIDLTRDIEETVTREFLAERKALKAEAAIRGRREFWKGKRAAA